MFTDLFCLFNQISQGIVSQLVMLGFDLSLFLSTAPQQQVIVQDSKILQHMSATGMVRT